MNKEKQKYTNSYVILFALYLTVMLAVPITDCRMTNYIFFYSTGATFIFPFSLMISDIVTEVYGYREARKMVWLTIICTFIFASGIKAVTHMPVAVFDFKKATSFDIGLNNILRIVSGGLTSVVVSTFLNNYILSRWKVFVKGRFFWFRSLTTSSLGNFISIASGMTLMFLNTVPNIKLIGVIIHCYLSVVICQAILVIPGNIIAKILKEKEGIDVYDININYNPFKFK